MHALFALFTALTLLVDAREAPRNVLHDKLTLPISGGPVTLVFPKWVPGEHAPANPVVDLVMLEATVNGTRVAWRRDPVDLFAFTFEAPAGAATLDLRYDSLLAPGYTTSELGLLNWNPTLLYPRGTNVSTTTVAAAMILPAGWSFATALDGPKRSGDRIDFAPVTIERLFDSPVLAGSNLTRVALGQTAELDVASDSPVPPIVNPAVKEHFTALVDQAEKLFASHHWRAPYHFLITATDAIGYTGLEHHESSWNGVDTDTLATDAACKKFAGDLLTHEFTHSWNGKFRRPAGLVRADYQADETTDGLWVYEGLTEYYSDVLAARAGFWTPGEYRAAIAAKYAFLDVEGGRRTRSLLDTTFEPRLPRGRAGFPGDRRSVEEYYDESELLWLDADTLIREHTQGKKSLDDFAAAFFGAGGDGPPRVVPYTRADVVTALNAVYPYDWEHFFALRLDEPTPHPPFAGIERGGYSVVFGAKPPDPNPSTRIGGDAADYRYGPGLSLTPSGLIRDVVAGSPADRAGLAPGMTIVGVDERRWNAAAFAKTIAREKSAKPAIVLLVADRGTFETKTLLYTGGVRIPYLQRTTAPDFLDPILTPR